MTSAPATMAIGRSRIEALAASVSRACTCFACSGTADAHSAADDAASAALLTARCAVPLKRSTWDVALSAIRSVAWCAACATSSTLALAGLAPLPLPARLLPKGVVRSILFHLMTFVRPGNSGQFQRISGLRLMLDAGSFISFREYKARPIVRLAAIG